MSHHRIAYEDIIRAAGHRVTPQRIHVLDAVCDGNGHTILGQIYARARTFDKTIDRYLVCRQCRQEQEIEHGVMQSMFDQVNETYGFRVDSDHLILSGLCADCQKAIQE